MHAHPGALAILAACSGTTHPDVGKAEIHCNSCFHLVDGQRPRPTHSPRNFCFPENYGRGWNLWFDLSNKLLVLSVPLSLTQQTSLFGPAVATRQKNLVTLENCGELDSHLRSGFSRSIGKTDNTQRKCLRASGIQNLRLSGPNKSVTGGSHGRENQGADRKNRKATGWCGFSRDGQSLASQGSPGNWCLGVVKLRLRLALVGPKLCSPDLRRRTRTDASHLRRWLHFILQLECRLRCYLLSTS
jgi:hypothetical protein